MSHQHNPGGFLEEGLLPEGRLLLNELCMIFWDKPSTMKLSVLIRTVLEEVVLVMTVVAGLGLGGKLLLPTGIHLQVVVGLCFGRITPEGS